jgi:anti-anti-sigma regulatory factor
MGSLAVNEVCWLDGSVAVIARGVVDDDTVELFERRLDLAIGTRLRLTGPRQLVIDLTDCRLESAGLAALIRLQRRSGSRPAAPRLVATGVDLLRMLEIIGVSRFRVYKTLEAAHHSGGPAPQPSAGEGALCRT